MIVVLVDEILKHPEKQFYKTNFFKDTLSIGDVDDGDNSTKLSIDVVVVRL